MRKAGAWVAEKLARMKVRVSDSEKDQMGCSMPSKDSFSESPAREPSGVLSKKHLKTSPHCADWITRGCSNVHGNNATWWTRSAWRARGECLNQRSKLTDFLAAAADFAVLRRRV
jgi:hypothetical protein